MLQLIEELLPQAAVQRTEPIVTELGAQQGGSGVPVAPEVATSRSVPAEKVEAPTSAKAEPQGSPEQLSAKALASEEKPAPSRVKAHVRGSKRQSSKPRDGKPAAQGAATPAYTFSIFAPASASPMYSRAVH
jgi:hypothetical protein